jgi:hypothetical protein
MRRLLSRKFRPYGSKPDRIVVPFPRPEVEESARFPVLSALWGESCSVLNSHAAIMLMSCGEEFMTIPAPGEHGVRAKAVGCLWTNLNLAYNGNLHHFR